MNSLWTSQELEAATLGRVTHDFNVQGISIDTRTLKPGDLFIALKGENRDAHGFVSAAFGRGAAAAMVSYRPQNVSGDVPLLLVANTQRGLEDIGRAACHRASKRIAVTGSAGKTTTKEMLRVALAASHATHASASSYNNHWGVPLSLAQCPRRCRYAIYEIGMNHFGEIRSLAGFVQPNVALVTTIAPAHLQYFGSVEAIADAKSEIFEALSRHAGTAVIPADNPCTERLRARARQAGVDMVFTFGQSAKADARLLSATDLKSGMRIESEFMGRRYAFQVGAVGLHIAYNALAAILAASIADADPGKAMEALAGFSALQGRGARLALPLGGGAIEIIDESYNANPASMRAALALLAATRPAEGGRRIAVLGDMLELGPQSAALHADLVDAVEDARADLVFACGQDMRALFEALPQSRRGSWAETSAEIAPEVARVVRAGDEVLIKGSLGSRMAVILDALKAVGGAF